MSKPSKKTLPYLFRNFFHIVPFVIIPAILFGMATPQLAKAKLIADVLLNHNVAQEDIFERIIDAFSVMRFASGWIWALVGFVLVVFAINALLYKIDRHMHLGIMSNKGLFRNGLQSILTTFVFCLMGMFVIELMYLIIIGLLYFLQTYMSVEIFFAIALALYFIVDVAVGYLLTLSLCTLPAIHSERFSLNVAISYSISLMNREKKTIIWTTVTYVLSKVLLVVLCLLFANNYYVVVTFSSLYYLAWFGFLPCFACRTYIRVNHDERHDLRPAK